MRQLKEYDVVRVSLLLTDERAYDGTPGVCRPPEVGDVAAICHQYSGDWFVVERVDPEGKTIWLAEFTTQELELVNKPTECTA